MMDYLAVPQGADAIAALSPPLANAGDGGKIAWSKYRKGLSVKSLPLNLMPVKVDFSLFSFQLLRQ